MTIKQMTATLSIKGNDASVAMLSERFAKVFAERKVKPSVRPGEFTWAAAAIDMEPVLRGWKPVPHPVAEFSALTGACQLFDARDEAVTITLDETEAPSDSLELFPYERADAIGAGLRFAVDELRKAGKFRCRHEPSKAELAAEAARVERANRHAAMIENFFNEHAGPEERFSINEIYQAFYDRHQRRKAG
jgi:hypothetical protein